MLAGAYDESAANCELGMRYTGTRTTFALSIIPVGITMTMTAITIASRSEETRETRGSTRGVRAYAHVGSTRRVAPADSSENC